MRGYDEELDRVRKLLEHELGYGAAEQPLVDEAVLAAGGRPEGVSAKIDVQLEFDTRADVAAAAVLRRLLEVMDANLPGRSPTSTASSCTTIASRSGARASVQRELRGVFAPAELAWFRAEFRWLQQVTGETRDLDVYVLEFEDFRALVPEPMRADLDPLLDVLSEHRAAAHAADGAGASVRAPIYIANGMGVVPASARLAARTTTARTRRGRSASSPPSGSARCTGGWCGWAARSTTRRPPEDYHELRKKGKELRYLLELFGAPLYPDEVVRPMIKALKGLQDVLGRHQDREVQIATLGALRDEVLARAGGAGALMAMGVLVERLERGRSGPPGAEFARALRGRSPRRPSASSSEETFA